jgi:hypothetical protein
MAGEFAARLKTKFLILSHFSPRYLDPWPLALPVRYACEAAGGDVKEAGQRHDGGADVELCDASTSIGAGLASGCSALLQPSKSPLTIADLAAEAFDAAHGKLNVCAAMDFTIFTRKGKVFEPAAEYNAGLKKKTEGN